jgi:hypothetical protein
VALAKGRQVHGREPLRAPVPARKPEAPLAWDHLLEGGWDRHPGRVPAEIATARFADPVTLDTGRDRAWELCAVEVACVPDLPNVPLEAGWPHGWRPADARRPA